MERLITFLKSKRIRHKKISERLIYINGKYYLLKLPVNGVLFDKNFNFVDDTETDCEYYVYSFCGKWYYTGKDSVNLIPLMYIGEIDSEIKTESFLGVHGGYELLNGSGLYDRWCKKAKFLGVKYLGICEKNTLAGVAKFQFECQNNGIQPIIGATYSIKYNDLKFDLRFYVESLEGWYNILTLNKLVNVDNLGFISVEVLKSFKNGLKCVLDPKTTPYEWAKLIDTKYYSLDTVIFDDPRKDKEYLINLKKYVDSDLLPVSICDAYYLEQEDYFIKNDLNTIASNYDFKSRNQFFKSNSEYIDELIVLVKDDSKFEKLLISAISNQNIIAKSCQFTLEKGQRHLPIYEMTPEEKSLYNSNEDLFWGLIEQGLKRLKIKDVEKYLDKVQYEYNVIEKGNVVDYFLMLHDIISWCNKNGILVGIGRGSAGGSVVSYLLGLIHLDPLEFDLLFERFMNEGRIKKTLPDIDTDVETTRRDDVKHYMEHRFGEAQVISVGTYSALQIKAAIKDLGRIYGLNFDEVNDITSKKLKGVTTFEELMYLAAKDDSVKKFVINNPELINSISLILGQPKAKSVHACAMIIFPKQHDMFHWCPIVKQDELYVSEWEGTEMEAVGFLKEDILGVKELDKFRNVMNLLKLRGINEDIYKIKYDDEIVYEYFRNGWTEDIFHFGSRGLTKYCKQLQPLGINDLIAGISLYRPGAIENNFHNEYILRKEGKKEIDYFIGSKEILDKTYGVFVYQEQIMKLCQVLGGLSLVEADDVRKAMVKKKYEELTKYKDRFIENYVKEFGVTHEYSEEVWNQIDKASTYLFNKSHATAYAITGYIGQYFKVHYPIEYWVTAFEFLSQDDINHGKISDYISEINKTGKIKIIPVDINSSTDKISTDGKSIYWSISSIKQIGEISASYILEERSLNGKYFSFDEFLSRCIGKGSKVNKAHVENLVLSGAFDIIENIGDNLLLRRKLIEYYREKYKVKTTPESDILVKNKEFVHENWWWALQQKKLSGIAFIDYDDIISQYFEGNYSSVDFDEFYEREYGKSYYQFGGIISEVFVRASKNGEYLTMKVDSNFNFFYVNIFPKHYKMLVNDGNKFDVGNMIILSGMIKHDDYREQNVVKVWDDSEVLVIDL